MTAFLAAFAVSSATLAVAAEASARVRDPLSGDKVSRLRAAVVSAPGRPVVLFLGSSRTGFAVHARRAEERLREMGLDALCFNLGLPSAGPVSELVTLNRVLAAGVRPTLVIVEVLPPMLHDSPDGPWDRTFLTADRLCAAEIRTVARFGFPRSNVVDRFVKARLAPWWTYRFSLWGRLAPSWLSYDVRGDWGRTADAGGWNAPIRDAVTEEERMRGDDRARKEYAARLANLTPGGGAAEAMKELIATCRARGIAVRLVLFPESTTFRSAYGSGVESRITEFLSGLDTPVTDARFWRPDGEFSDGHHLTGRGAAAFTDHLTAEVLVPTLSAGGRRD